MTDGIHHITQTFSNPIFVVLYLVALGALWFHLTHGFWSALQTIGWNNKIWFNRWKLFSNLFATVIFLGFASVVVFTFAKPYLLNLLNLLLN